MKCNRPEWAAEAVNRMRQYGIRYTQLAEEACYDYTYVKQILAGTKISKRAQIAILAALERLIAKRTGIPQKFSLDFGDEETSVVSQKEVTVLQDERELQTRYYTCQETAKILQVTPCAVHNWIYIGKLAAVKFGRQYFISAEALKRFINEKPAKIRPEWTKKAVNCMYQYGIRCAQLAKEAGYTYAYVNSILSGSSASRCAKPVILAALERLIAKKEEVTL